MESRISVPGKSWYYHFREREHVRESAWTCYYKVWAFFFLCPSLSLSLSVSPLPPLCHFSFSLSLSLFVLLGGGKGAGRGDWTLEFLMTDFFGVFWSILVSLLLLFYLLDANLFGHTNSIEHHTYITGFVYLNKFYGHRYKTCVREIDRCDA